MLWEKLTTCADDIHHASMLKDANEAGAPAPAPLNGTFHGEPEGEGWIDRNRRRKSQERPSVSRSSTGSQEARVPSPRRSIDLDSSTVTGSTAPSQPASPGTTTPSRRDKEARSSSHPDVKRVRGASSVSMNPSPPRTVTAKDTLTVSARGSSSLHSRAVFPSSNTEPLKHNKTENGGSKTPTKSPGSASLSLPPENTVPETNSSRVTVSSLLDRLTSLHDVQQKERKSDWDDFLRHRRTKLNSKSKSRARGTGSVSGRENMASGGPGFIGVSEMGRGEEWKSFLRLVRGGIPLSYRSDIWAGKLHWWF